MEIKTSEIHNVLPHAGLRADLAELLRRDYLAKSYFLVQAALSTTEAQDKFVLGQLAAIKSLIDKLEAESSEDGPDADSGKGNVEDV